MIFWNILWPAFAMVALVMVVWFTLFFQRFSHIRRTPPTAADFTDGEAARRYFGPVEMPANNLANLFEMPVLFFALVPLLIVTGQASAVQIVFAWVFVLFRGVHSFIHIGPKKVQARFFAYLLSVVVLFAMWIGFFIDMVALAGAYTDTIGNMEAAA